MTRTCKTCGCPLTDEFIALEVKAAVETYRAAEGRCDGALLVMLPGIAVLGGGA